MTSHQIAFVLSIVNSVYIALHIPQTLDDASLLVYFILSTIAIVKLGTHSSKVSMDDVEFLCMSIALFTAVSVGITMLYRFEGLVMTICWCICIVGGVMTLYALEPNDVNYKLIGISVWMCVTSFSVLLAYYILDINVNKYLTGLTMAHISIFIVISVLNTIYRINKVLGLISMFASILTARSLIRLHQLTYLDIVSNFK